MILTDSLQSDNEGESEILPNNTDTGIISDHGKNDIVTIGIDTVVDNDARDNINIISNAKVDISTGKSGIESGKSDVLNNMSKADEMITNPIDELPSNICKIKEERGEILEKDIAVTIVEETRIEK